MKRLSFLFGLMIALTLCVISLRAVDANILDLERSEIQIKKGERKTLVFEQELDVVHSEIIWHHPNSDILKLDFENNEWVIEGLSYGSAYLTGVLAGETRFNVLVQVFDSMVFKSNEVQLDIGEPFQSTLVFQPATSIEQFEPVYQSSDESVASVNDEGLIMAHKIGKVTITASYLSMSATKEVEVIDRPDFAYLESSQVINVGDGVNIPYRLSLYGDNVDKTIVWSSLDESIATVDQRGVVYGVSSGSTSVTAIVNGLEYTTKIDVISNVEEIVFEDNEVDIAVGQESFLAYSILPIQYQDIPIVWISSRPSVARVNNGIVVGISAGTTVITARINEVEASVTVNVTLPLTGLTITPSRLSLEQGQRFHLRVSPKPANSSEALDLKFRSSDETILTVDDYGNITALQQGRAFVFVSHNEFMSSIEVVVVYGEDDSGQKLVIGSPNSQGIVTFDLRGISEVSEFLLEIPWVNTVNALGQVDVRVQLSEAAFSNQKLLVGGLQFSDDYENKDISLMVIDADNQELIQYQLYDFRQTKRNVMPSADLIEGQFLNFKNHIIELNLPIELSRMDRLSVLPRLNFHPDYKIYEESRNNLRLVSAVPLTFTSDNKLVLSNLDAQLYYFTNLPLQSRITPFLFILVGIMALMTSFFVLKRYNKQSIELENEKRSRHESVNYQQQNKETQEKN